MWAECSILLQLNVLKTTSTENLTPSTTTFQEWIHGIPGWSAYMTLCKLMWIHEIMPIG